MLTISSSVDILVTWYYHSVSLLPSHFTFFFSPSLSPPPLPPSLSPPPSPPLSLSLSLSFPLYLPLSPSSPSIIWRLIVINILSSNDTDLVKVAGFDDFVVPCPVVVLPEQNVIPHAGCENPRHLGGVTKPTSQAQEAS